jgi:hypothetical protein
VTCFLKVVVLSLWGALSDERSGPSIKEFPSLIEREREREKKVGGGGSERHYRLEGGVTET